MLKSQICSMSEGVKSVLKKVGSLGGDSRDPTADARDQVNFVINGTPYSVKATDELYGPESRLVDFIRDRANLKGTKWTCREGGCGACVVTARTKDPHSGEEVVRAVNSCLAPVWSCDGWDISTVEDLGNKRDGYHPIQKRLVQFGGTQCGFCSAGMVMNMYALASSKQGGLSSDDVEDNFDGNICRCTGYRSIMDAMKSFAVDADPKLKSQCGDLEDICAPKRLLSRNEPEKPAVESKNRLTVKNALCCGGGCCGGGDGGSGDSMSKIRNSLPTKLELKAPAGEKWVKATDLKTVFDTLKNFTKNNQKYRMVAGNTGTGVFKYDGPYDAYVEVNSVPDLTVQSINKNEAILGGATTLTRTIEFLQNLSQKEGFEYAAGVAKHVKRVANTPVRNFATIAGNLMMKHAHNDFPSDIFLLMETIGAKLFIASSPTDIQSYSPVDFLKVDMKSKVIVYLTLPVRTYQHVFRSYKITKRYQNAHAYVNAGFLMKIDSTQNFKVLEKPTITFGGINPNFLRAQKTETALNGVELGNIETVKNVIKILEQEIQPDHHLPDASPEYRKNLSLNLLYKTILGIVSGGGKGITKNVQSGGDDLPRKLHSGKQVYDIDQEFKDSPLYKAVPKIEGNYQVSGEAEYVNDIPKQINEVYGAFVLSTVANCNLKNVDASEALKMPGVLKFLTAKDIPGKNSYYNGFYAPIQEEVFVSSKIEASGLAIGLIVAETQDIAKAAAGKVKVEYDQKQKPLLSIKDGVDQARKDGTFDKLMYPLQLKSPTEPSKTSKHVIKGEFRVGAQAHFHMETHVALAVPMEDGYKIYSATQWMDLVQGMVAQVLNVPSNTIEVEVRRLGGAYGAKCTRSSLFACAAALASHVTRRPCRVVVDFEENMEMVGKRLPFYVEYNAGFDDAGKIDALTTTIMCDTGMFGFEGTSPAAAMAIQNCYAANGWVVTPGRVVTNTHSNTATRAPGTPQGMAVIETVMEHIADILKKDPLEIRAANWLQKGDPLIIHAGLTFQDENLIPMILDELKKTADYDQRKMDVEEFNKNNRWRKRGIATVPMRYSQHYIPLGYPSFVAIHNHDGTVTVTHGGIEMGQGINTKVAQVVAHELKIPLNKIVVKPSNTVTSANAGVTGGASTSELICYATLKVCQELLGRMEPIKKASDKELTWEQLVTKCNGAGIDLRATYQYSKNDTPKPYDVYGCTVTEAEVDILTGEFKIVRMDLIEDAGKSLSPDVDIGQIEGCVVMGLGLWTEEKLVFHPETGRLLTRNTWEYKIPFPKDVPEDLRVTMLHNRPNPLGVLNSKATGEPPICLTVAALFAIKNAIKSARKDAGNEEWFQLDGPVTPEDVVRLSLTNPESHFVL